MKLLGLLLLGVAVTPQDFDVQENSNFQVTLPAVDASNVQNEVVGIECCIRYMWKRDVQRENGSSLPSEVSTMFSNGALFVKLGDEVIHEVIYDDQSSVGILPAFDGVIDFDGDSGEFVDFPMRSGFLSTVITDPLLISRIISGEQFTVEGFDLVTTAGPGNFYLEATSAARVLGRINILEAP